MTALLYEGTVCFPIDQERQRILLGMKKQGVGAGYYNGFGGKIEIGETPLVAAARELWEESSLTAHAAAVQAMGHVNSADGQRRMHVFVVTDWQGSPQESNEMIPYWFPITDLPYDQMWPTDRDWLPHVLAGRRISVVVYKHLDGSRTSKVQVVEA